MLVSTYLEDSQARLTHLFEVQDAKALRDSAHSFKGSSSNMGAAGLARLCCDLEHLPLAASQAEVCALREQIHSEFVQVRTAFLAMLATDAH